MTHKRGTAVKANAGFTLIEFSIVVLIAAVLLAAGLSLYRVQLVQHTFDVTEETHEALQKAMLNFIDDNQRLPCPAGPNRPSSNMQYGMEDVAGCGTAGAYTLNGGVASSPPGGPATGPSGNRVLIGVIPFRTLKVKEALTRDGYGRRLTYAVTKDLTRPNSMPIGSPFPDGTIRVENAFGVPLTTTARFVSVSHGANGRGAYVRNGARVSCPTPAVSPTERKNCDDDNSNVFVADFAQDDYDDMVSYDFTNNSSLLPPLCMGNNALQWDGVQWVCTQSKAPKNELFSTPGTYTWTKDASYGPNALVDVECWGGGGGGRAEGSEPSGGGGGGYVRAQFSAGSLGATETVVVGAGGEGGNNDWDDPANTPNPLYFPDDGGTSSFGGSKVVATGGSLGFTGYDTYSGGDRGFGGCEPFTFAFASGCRPAETCVVSRPGCSVSGALSYVILKGQRGGDSSSSSGCEGGDAGGAGGGGGYAGGGAGAFPGGGGGGWGTDNNQFTGGRGADGMCIVTTYAGG